MAMLFFLLSILWFLKGMQLARVGEQRTGHFSDPVGIGRWTTCDGKWYCLSLAAFVMAMLSKGSVVVLPVLLLGIIWWQRGRMAAGPEQFEATVSDPVSTRRSLLLTAPFFLVAIVLATVNVWFQTHGSGEALRVATFLERLLGAGGVVWFYLYKALLPLDLAFIYPTWRVEAGNPLWWLPLLAAIGVTAALWRYRNGWSRPLLFAWGYFCVSLLPVMGFIDVGFMKHSLVADHYQHIAIIGVIALAAAGWSIWRRRERNRAYVMTTAIAMLAVGALTALTSRQSGIYQNPISLYQATLQKNPSCWLAHNNLGLALVDAGGLESAIDHYQQSILLKPDYAEAHNNLGAALAKVGRLHEAIEEYRRALQKKPDYIEAHNNLGVALVEAGRPQEAIEHYRRALALNPDFATFYCNLALAYAKMQRYSEAIGAAQKGLELARSQG
jgi:protein O-mannosyl-transferase